MKHKSILWLAIAFSPLAVGETEVNHQSLAAVQAMLEYCAQIRPGDAAKFQEQTGLLTNGLAENVVLKVRDASDYKAAYASANTALAKADPHEAAKACDGFLAEGNADKAGK